MLDEVTVIKAVVFDLDGVIINSNPEIEKFWYEWAIKENVELDESLVRQYIHGRKGVETIENLFNHCTDAIKEEIIRTAIVFDTNMRPSAIDGVTDFIKQLQTLPIKLGLVTSSHNARMLVMLKHHDLHHSFTFYVTAEDVSKGKPDPEPYLAIADKLQVNCGECLVFEDAVSGVQSAKAAGMHVIGVNTINAANALITNGAIACIETFNQLHFDNKILTITPNVSFTLMAGEAGDF